MPKAKHRRRNSMCVVCTTNTDTCFGRRSKERWLLAFAHPSNGLGNRLAGLRAVVGIAQATSRKLAVRWLNDAQESSYLRPATAGQWNVSGEPSLRLERPSGSPRLVRPQWESWPGKACPAAYGRTGVAVWPQRFMCGGLHQCSLGVPALEELTLREPRDVHARDEFLRVARGAAPLVIVDSQSKDVLAEDGQSQAAGAHAAHAQYRALFAPRVGFTTAACAHLRRLGLHTARAYVGLQLRRSPVPGRDRELLMAAAHGPRLADLLGRDEALSGYDEAGVRAAVDCARRMQAALCAARSDACRAPIFITSSSVHALELAARLVGPDARYARDEAYTLHTGPKAGHLAAILEMATLSAATAIIGTAGSSFAIEAANLGNTTAVLRDWEHMYRTVTIGPHSLQGDCDRVPLMSGRSVLLPPEACA